MRDLKLNCNNEPPNEVSIQMLFLTMIALFLPYIFINRIGCINLTCLENEKPVLLTIRIAVTDIR